MGSKMLTEIARPLSRETQNFDNKTKLIRLFLTSVKAWSLETFGHLFRVIKENILISCLGKRPDKNTNLRSVLKFSLYS